MEVSGRGSLTILATGETLPLIVLGYTLSSGVVHVRFQSVDDSRAVGYGDSGYGYFDGQVAKGALTGTLSTFEGPSTTGPFAGQPPVSVVFSRP
jgi:hypothetical protein